MGRCRLEDLRSYLDKDYPYIQVNRVNRGGSTLALLSKYPITETKEIPIDSWVNGAIAYKVLIRGEETLIINVHLESFHLRRVDGEDYLRLASQGNAVRLKDAMGAKLAPTFRAHGVQANVIHQAHTELWYRACHRLWRLQTTRLSPIPDIRSPMG